MKRLLIMAVLTTLAIGCSRHSGPDPMQYGPNPQLPPPERGLLPTMKIADPVGWGNRRPTVPQGYTITPIATGFGISRQTLVLPNGDILVAEGRGGGEHALRPKDVIAGYIKAKGTSSAKSGNRLTLLRDANGDGVYELRTVFADKLNAPYGLALVGKKLYVADQDALLGFDYSPGQTKASAPPVKVTDLPAAINHHWTKSLTASPDGRYLYVGIGSNSNITERGMPAEIDRAQIWQIDTATGAHRTFASGVRNPTALAIQPGTGKLWATVQERDEIGPNLVPDYLTSVRDGGFYGWPYSYWGQHVDPRAQPQDPKRVAAAIRPDYGLGSHVAALGLSFSNPAMGPRFAEGVFVGEHGSWNRSKPAGYKVVFVPFRGGRPAGLPIDVVTGFEDPDGKTRGRPVGVTVDPRGALIVADDLSNTIWRMVPAHRAPVAEAPSRPARPPGKQKQPGTYAPY
jgi:glucose/arabinose dehydrogenase